MGSSIRPSESIVCITVVNMTINLLLAESCPETRRPFRVLVYEEAPAAGPRQERASYTGLPDRMDFGGVIQAPYCTYHFFMNYRNTRDTNLKKMKSDFCSTPYCHYCAFRGCI